MNRERIKQTEVEAEPEITPQMIQTKFKILEMGGITHRTENAMDVSPERGWKMLAKTKPVGEEIIAYGHPNITATHTTTFEITKHTDLTKDGDCIICIGANKACKDLNREFKNTLKEAKKIELTIEAEGVSDKIVAYGSPALKLSHPDDIVVRKSDFIDNRTLAILADKSANELKQDLVERLRNPKTQVKINLEIK